MGRESWVGEEKRFSVSPGLQTRKPVFHDSVTVSWRPVKMPNLFLAKVLKFN